MKRIAVSLLLFIIAVSLHAQVWTWQHPKPQGNNLNAVDFFDGNTGYAVGDNGTILKTTNGGIAWVAQQSGITTNLLTVCVSPASAQYAVAAGTNNTYVYTADGGNTWTAGNVTASNVNAGYNWRGSFFYFVNNEVFLCGDNGYIVESVDNGATFAASVRTGAPAYISNRHRSNDTLYSLAFYASSKPAIGFGIVVGSNSHVSVTSDGGNAWLDTNFVTPNYTLTGVAVPEQNSGYTDGSIVGYNALGTGGIWNTTNNGYTWAVSNSTVNFAYLGVGLAADGEGPVYAVSQQGKIATAGSSPTLWSADNNFNNNFNSGSTQLNAVSIPKYNFMCIVGNAGKIFVKSTVSANQWVERDSGSSAGLHDIAFADTKAGYACGNGGALILTSDGGAHWKDTKINGIDTLMTVSFADAKHGYAAGENGQIYYTANAGGTWAAQLTPISDDITCIRAIDSAAAWACSAAGALLFTTNAGNTWDSVRSPNSAPMAKVFFLNRNIGWVMADQYYIYRTLDGGATWYRNQITADPNVTLNGLWFSDILHGWVTGSNGFVALTSNSDSTWQQVAAGSFIPQIPNGVSVNAIGFIDAQNGWIAGTGGTIYFSNDSGNTWHAQASGTVNDLFGLDMVDIGNGWTAGNNGAILKFSNNGSSLAFAGKVIDFGRVAFGLTKTVGISLKNSGSTAIQTPSSVVLRAAPIDQSGIDGQFTLENIPGSVSPNGDSLLFTFRPIATGGGVGQPRLRAGVADIYGQGGLEPSLTLIGNGAYSSLQLISPSKKLDFQSVYVGHCSKPFIIVVKNTGEIPITLSEVVNDTLFHLLDPGQTIQPGEVDTLHLIYCPIKPGVDNGSIIINGAPKPDTVLLVGQGIKVAISFLKNRLDTIFCSYGFIDMSVANIGNTIWYIQNPIIRNPDGYLQLVNVSPANGGCGQGQPLNKGDTCFFKFQITDPKAPAGTCDSTWLVFTDEVGDLLDSVFFNWCDESSNINDYDVKPLFTCIPVGTCETRTVVLTNGGADLVLDSIAIQGLNAGAYYWTDSIPANLSKSFPYPLPKGGSVTIVWHFCPTVNDTGDQSNARIVSYYAPCGQGSPVIGDTNSDAFGACGILQGFSVNPSCIEFGDTLRLGKDTPKTLANTLHFINAGATPITIYITDLHPATDFSFNPVDSLVVPANGAIDTFSATFSPNTPGCKDDTLLFYSLQPAQSAKVCMHGCAFTQGLFWSPTNIPFGSVLIGDSACATGYIKNTGSDTITIGSESGSSTVFTITLLGGTLPYSIPPGDSVFVRFCYVPKQLGGDSLSVSFTTPIGSATFTLQGTGYSIGQTCVGLVPPPRIITQNLGKPVAVDIDLLQAIPNTPAHSFRAAITFDTTRLQFQGVQSTPNTSGWMLASPVTFVNNGEILFTLYDQSGTAPLTQTGAIAHVVFAPYYGSSLSTPVAFDPFQLGGFKFNVLPGQDSTNPALSPSCVLDTAIVTYDSICGLTISKIVFQQGTFLYQNAPNPIDAVTGTIQFQTGTDGFVQLLLFNQFGVQVQQLAGATMKAGMHTVDVDTRALPAGSYFYELIAPDKTIIRRMVVIK